MKEKNLSNRMDSLHKNIFEIKFSCSGSPNPFRAKPYLNKSSTEHCNLSQDLLSSDIQTTVLFKDIESKNMEEKERWWGAISLQNFRSSMTILEIVP
jgi:hypothetical protein